MVMEELILVDVSKKMKASHIYKPRAWRWLNPKPPISKSLVNVLIKRRVSASELIHKLLEGCLLKPSLFRDTNKEPELLP